VILYWNTHKASWAQRPKSHTTTDQLRFVKKQIIHSEHKLYSLGSTMLPSCSFLSVNASEQSSKSQTRKITLAQSKRQIDEQVSVSSKLRARCIKQALLDSFAKHHRQSKFQTRRS
jgi:hypothetical protein